MKYLTNFETLEQAILKHSSITENIPTTLSLSFLTDKLSSSEYISKDNNANHTYHSTHRPFYFLLTR